jgi:hypothetical protein
MISNNCSIDEFVETIKGQKPSDVIVVAIDEADNADRMIYRYKRELETLRHRRRYSNQLKQLINYLQFEITPRRKNDKVYDYYMTYWNP